MNVDCFIFYSDPLIIRVRINWPDGEYCLHISPCPESGEKFEWSQDGPYYCCKHDTSHDDGLSWPKGTYCINVLKYPPDGFHVDYCDGLCFGCRYDGSPETPIVLPANTMFRLALGLNAPSCQSVLGMHVDSAIEDYYYYPDI